jgi:serine/threonine-protein kinase PknK
MRVNRGSARHDPLPTQRGMPVGIAAEVVAAGFTDPAEIGRGGFGVVYRCNQCALNRTGRGEGSDD